MKEILIEDLRDARDLLHGQGIDLLFGLRMWTIFKKANVNLFPQFLEGLEIPAARLHFSHVLMTLCKTAETYRRYKYLLPEAEKEMLKGIAEEIERRKIPAFRNKVIGHIWDKDTGRPLSSEEVEKRIKEIVPDKLAFFTWILNLNDARDPETVVGKIQGVVRTLDREIKDRTKA